MTRRDDRKSTGALTFDLDGTLIDSPFDRLVFPWVDREFAHRGVRGARALFRDEQLRRFDDGRRREGFDWDDIARTVAAEQGVDWDHDLCAVMAGALAEPLRAFPPYPDVAGALDALCAQGFSLFVISNGYARYQRLTLELMGLGGYFAATLGPDTIGCAKPDPKVFAAPELQAPVTAHVGDLLTQDVAAARGAGVPAVLVIRPDMAAPGYAPCADHSPGERPRMLLESGWLAAQLEKEHRYLGRAAPDVALTVDHAACPDAVVLNLGELPALVGEWRRAAAP